MELQILIRRKETVECRNCRGEGRDSTHGRHDEVDWHDCRDCDGEGEIETWVYYWVDDIQPTKEQLDEMDGTRHSLFWR
jgi:hypothetical protein